MDNFNTNPSPAPVVADPAPVSGPVYTPPAPPTNTPAPQQFQEGGKVNLFDGLTFVDVGMLILSTVALSYTIYYYRSKLKELKHQDPTITAMQSDLKEVKMNLQNALGSKYKSSS